MLLKSKHMNGKEVLSWLTQESGKIKETEGVRCDCDKDIINVQFNR